MTEFTHPIEVTPMNDTLTNDINTAVHRLADTVELHSLRIERDLLTWQVELLRAEVESLRGKRTPETDNLK